MTSYVDKRRGRRRCLLADDTEGRALSPATYSMNYNYNYNHYHNYNYNNNNLNT